MVVYKYPFEIDDSFTLQMPREAKILSVQVQNGVPCIWALVDEEKESELRTRHFLVAGTGHKRGDLGFAGFLGTIQMMGGRLVFHVFEDLPF